MRYAVIRIGRTTEAEVKLVSFKDLYDATTFCSMISAINKEAFRYRVEWT